MTEAGFADEVAAVPWAYIFHAYGPATDTPGHLQALHAGDDPARAAAVEHLVSAIVHQGTVWPASPDALRLAAVAVAARPLPADLAADLEAALAEAADMIADAPEQPDLSIEATTWCWQACVADDFDDLDTDAPEFAELMAWAATESAESIDTLLELLASPST